MGKATGSDEVILLNVVDLKKVIAFIPPNHLHTRLLIELRNGPTIIYQQAVMDGAIRAYFNVALHPTNKVSEYLPELLPKKLRKPGFAEWQLIPSRREENEVMREAVEAFEKALKARKSV